jgi:UDP-N-acetylmuramate dehydrogenase
LIQQIFDQQIDMVNQTDHFQPITAEQIEAAQHNFGSEMQRKVELARYTTARVGGPAEGFIEAGSAEKLVEIVTKLWSLQVPFILLGGGSNVLVSDEGLPLVVVLNRCKSDQGFQFIMESEHPKVKAESGVNLSNLAQRAGELGLSGLEWAGGIPGTVGGAIVGNAGAHGSNMQSTLLLADILQQNSISPTLPPERFQWTPESLEYGYRQSKLKSSSKKAVVLGALLKLERSTQEDVKKLMDEYRKSRRERQPSGASMGSIFKNPQGDYAGRLIEAAGLKGKRIGNAEISLVHANFFINTGNARAEDIEKLIMLVKASVMKKYNVELNLEIELLGHFSVGQIEYDDFNG